MITQYIIDWGLLESLILISMIWFHLYQLLDTENCDFNTIEFFCRSDNTQEELGELAKTANPDAIDIDDDFSSDEEAEVEGMIIFKMKILCNTYSSFFIVYLNDKYMYMQYAFGNWIKSWMNVEIMNSYQKYIIQTLSAMYLFFRNGSEVCSNWSFWVSKEWGGRRGLNRI